MRLRLPAKPEPRLLLNQSPLSHIDSLYLSDDATVTGNWTYCEVPDISSAGKKAVSVTFGLDGTGFANIVPIGVKGYRSIFIPSCTNTLYQALRGLSVATHRTFTGYHPSGTLSWDVQVLSTTSPYDDQWRAGDLWKDVTVKLLVHGTV